MKERFVDTSAMYAVLDEADEFHARAVESLEQMRDEDCTMIVSNYVVLETTALLHTTVGKGAARDFMERYVPLMRLEWIDPQTHGEATTAYLLSTDKNISLVDCTSFVLMKKLSIRGAFTFDKHFKEQGFEVTLG